MYIDPLCGRCSGYRHGRVDGKHCLCYLGQQEKVRGAL